jgi:hydroxymethylpyrimidine pyrophosphatase-like HAD family hydrolase
VLFAVTSGLPPLGMGMLVSPLEMRGPMAAFNGGIIVMPDMTIVDERVIPTDVTSAVIDTITALGLYAWIYRGAEWYVTDHHAPHAERKARTVQFQPSEATFVTASNEDEGFAKAIEEFILPLAVASPVLAPIQVEEEGSDVPGS